MTHEAPLAFVDMEESCLIFISYGMSFVHCTKGMHIYMLLSVTLVLKEVLG